MHILFELGQLLQFGFALYGGDVLPQPYLQMLEVCVTEHILNGRLVSLKIFTISSSFAFS
jgi:hypothetical protein